MRGSGKYNTSKLCQNNFLLCLAVSKSNLSLHLLYYAKACNELVVPDFASSLWGNTARFEEMSRRWRVVGNTLFNLTAPRFESLTPAPVANALSLDLQASPRFD